ncbi:Neurolysin/Thimet oligopeptidase N-terminal [Penicillium cinerascens]|uniref:Neurolysin/Thimet oligopeptidase N-terminal n=1 Tax=Penicillium cinerascens TaxID=70096 RepID=A0A9W9MAT2_9EURO|nr:Neurolysin/Thimet oligopeptidase N-terminal [Penicillium cinerascens]KAJ5195625.1 Neurolysin/Thimet oligopeptidase N-terminal [Penicillium cinerascens]
MASTGEPPSFNITPFELSESASTLISRMNKSINDLALSVSPEQASFENTILPFANIENEIKGKVQYMALFQAVSPDPEMRKASSTAVSIVDKAYLGLFQDRSLFALVHAVQSTCLQDTIDAEDRKYLKRLHSLFWNNGIGLEGSASERFNTISDRLMELQVSFMENLGSDPGRIWKTEDELAGLAQQELDDLVSNGILLKRSRINMVLSRCHNSDTRKDIFLRGQNTFPENASLLEETLILRDEAARLLGFSSFAAQKGGEKIFSSPESIRRMLDELADYLRPIARKELKELRYLKNSSDGSFFLWDFDYYHDLLLRERYEVDHELISEYFPALFTTGKMLVVFEAIFGLSIQEIKDLPQERTWHPEVQVFRVEDAETSQLLGFLYVDIFHRAGKYSHAANFNIYPVGSSIS